MSDMNSALSVWQLVIIAVVPLAALCGWIITVFIVAREPRAPAATGSSAGLAVAGTGSASSAAADEPAGATANGPDQPAEPPARRLAA
jgi:hypothetical protein